MGLVRGARSASASSTNSCGRRFGGFTVGKGSRVRAARELGFLAIDNIINRQAQAWLANEGVLGPDLAPYRNRSRVAAILPRGLGRMLWRDEDFWRSLPACRFCAL